MTPCRSLLLVQPWSIRAYRAHDTFLSTISSVLPVLTHSRHQEREPGQVKRRLLPNARTLPLPASKQPPFSHAGLALACSNAGSYPTGPLRQHHLCRSDNASIRSSSAALERAATPLRASEFDAILIAAGPL